MDLDLPFRLDNGRRLKLPELLALVGEGWDVRFDRDLSLERGVVDCAFDRDLCEDLDLLRFFFCPLDLDLDPSFGLDLERDLTLSSRSTILPKESRRVLLTGLRDRTLRGLENDRRGLSSGLTYLELFSGVGRNTIGVFCLRSPLLVDFFSVG